MHAITPSAGHPREPDCNAGTVADCETRFSGPNFAAHPVNAANRERSMRAVNLALQIADDVVLAEVESNCDFRQTEGTYWCDTKFSSDQELVDRAIRYIELREPDAFPFRFIRHPDQPHLVRFEDKP